MRLFAISLLLTTFLFSAVHAENLDEFISPIGNPFTFEDPRALTEARLVYLYNEIGNDFITQGGDVRTYALQLRYAVDENLSLLITKAGYIEFNPDTAVNDQSGFGNITVGGKLTIYGQGPLVAALGLKYEIPAGSNDVFQGQGSGFVNPFLSVTGAWGPLNTTLGTGFRIATQNDDPTLYDLDLHIDTPMGNFYPTVEFNFSHVVSAGDRVAIDDEGLDLLNFGASGADGSNVFIGGIGGRYRLDQLCDIGLIYQAPLSNSKGSAFMDWRVTADLIVRFK